MAPKKAAKAKPKRTPKSTLADRIADAALDLAAQKDWASLSVPKVAEACGEPLGVVLGVYPTTNRIASALMSRIDHDVLHQVQTIDHSETPRDRLFEILMIRFDALQRHRSGYEALIRGLFSRPSAILMRAPRTIHSMALMLIAAGIDASSPLGMLRAHALAVAYGSVVRVWLADDSADLAKTMAALDKSLNRLEKMQSLIPNLGPARARESDDGEM